MISNNIYCVYLTIYRGSKLPPFYIGSSSIKKIKSGYHGSVSSREYKNIWLEELKENPNLFQTKIISTHNTREEAVEKENYFHHKLNVVKNSLYTNKWYAVPNGFNGYDSRGKNNPMYGKSRPDSSERMKTNNPIHNKKSQQKILEAKARKYKEGTHKSTSNKPQTIEKTKDRMSKNNPSFVRCSCLECHKELPMTHLKRHIQLSHSPFEA